MDDSLFDSLTRSLTTVRSRRDLRRLFGGLALGALPSAITVNTAMAGTLLGGADCTKGADCKSGRCLNPRQCDCRRTNCTCTCSCSQTNPVVRCAKPSNPCKKAVCTATGRCLIKRKCDDGNPCTKNLCDADGTCSNPNVKNGTTCPNNGSCCQGKRVNLQQDSANCGRCAHGCETGMFCATGKCVVGQGTCKAGDNSCDFTNTGLIYCGRLQAGVECQCLISAEGEPRCTDNFGITGSTGCGECATSADCEAKFKDIPGVFCVKVSGAANECCAPGTRGMCVAPCPPPRPCSTIDNCPDDGIERRGCGTRTCTNGRCGFSFVPDGEPSTEQNAGDCQKIVCNGNGDSREIADDDDLPDDGNDCTDDLCADGVQSHPARAKDFPCIENGQAGLCDGAGNCLVS